MVQDSGEEFQVRVPESELKDVAQDFQNGHQGNQAKII